MADQTSFAYRSLGYQQVTSLSASAGLTVPAGATRCLLQCETQNVRYRIDGATTAPTASVGMILYAGAPATPFEGNMNTVRFIEVAASAKLNVEYFSAKQPEV